MTIFAVGDIQGCFDELRLLLDDLLFDENKDQLWFTGDLVNRGPNSLCVLRFVKSLGPAAITVLGNHDLHLLAIAEGLGKKSPYDNMDDVLEAPDRDELLHWLRQQPLLHYDQTYNTILVHAGLPPQWTLEDARACAKEVENVLRGTNYKEFFRHMYGSQPNLWTRELPDIERHRFITNALTRMRYCAPDGRIDVSHKGKPGSQPAELIPWFEVGNRKSKGHRIVFGHWSTLGLIEHAEVISLDTGCLWGGQLTAAKIDGEKKYIQRACVGAAKPNSD